MLKLVCDNGTAVEASSHFLIRGGAGAVTSASGNTVFIEIPNTSSISPPSSHDATSKFGNTLSAGTAVQNTLGYDILLTICVFVVSTTAPATITLGVGSTNPPTVDTVFNDSAGGIAGNSCVGFSAYIPNNYYVLVGSTGTISIGNITCVACPV